jgi:uncharacterized membrane protein YfcA
LVLSLFVLAGIAGTFVGARLAHRIPTQRLRQIFSAFVIILGIILLLDNFPQLTR